MNEETLFELVLNTPEADRVALLDRECAGNAELRQRVEALLVAHVAPDIFVDPNAPGDVNKTGAYAGPRATTTATAGTIIAGKYKLLQQIGEGGMGTVWMADQTEPVKRRVAVKLIHAERGSSKTILSRFEAERQAIALMDHPHIAKLLDAGTTDEDKAQGRTSLGLGVPYFVMELVKGVPLTDFCDAHKLSIPQRLNLFMQICSAVQHAHQKGIIHRDLKPSNILVESHDGKPVPKVIDFGLAKATSGLQLTEHTLFTGFGTVMGTPLYMSPEQAAFNAVDVDTRADVYALGVILYELLTGTTPLTRETVKKAALDEMLKLIREQEAPTPSSRLSSSESKPAVAANRQMEPLKLGRFVKGELDWIVMKVLSKERDRRYETANGFAKDIERFLNHEPVLAGPPSARYRVRKFVQRNRGQVIAASLILLVLIAGIVGTTAGLIRAEQQRRLAEHERAKAEKAESETLDDYKASTDDAIEQLIGSKPELGPKEKTYLENTLKRWQAFAARQEDDERSRAIRAEGHSRVGSLWGKLGRQDEARTEYLAAHDIQKTLVEQFPTVPAYRQALALSYKDLGALLFGLEKGTEARTEYLAAHDIQKKLVEQFPTVPAYRQALAHTHHDLGSVHLGLGEGEAARAQYVAARDLQQKLVEQFSAVPEYRRDLAGTHRNLGLLHANLGEFEEARAAYMAARSLQQKMVEQYSAMPEYQQDLARTYNSVGNLFARLRKHEEARAEYEAARDIQKKLVDQFPAVPAYRVELGANYCNNGNQYRDEGKPAESLKWFDLAIQTLNPVHEKEPHDGAARYFLRNSHISRACAFDNLQNFAEAVTDWGRAIDLDSPIERPRLRASRATSQLRAGMVAEAVAEVAELTTPVGDARNSPMWNAGQWYYFACIYAVASSKIATQKQEYADRAMELLQKAVKAGYKDAARMAKDTDLDSLRGREDFKKLLAEMEKNASEKK
jgi:eukaryotic-like serine/threonine-protein kinase